MLLFCPLCMNILAVTQKPEEGNRFRLECRTCPYEHLIEKEISSRRYFWKRKEEDNAVTKLLENTKADSDQVSKEGIGKNVAKENLLVGRKHAAKEGDADLGIVEQAGVEMAKC